MRVPSQQIGGREVYMYTPQTVPDVSSPSTHDTVHSLAGCALPWELLLLYFTAAEDLVCALPLDSPGA